MDESAIKIENQLATFSSVWKELGWKALIDITKHRSPVRTRGLDILASSGRMVLPICLNNGYYKREMVHRLLMFSSAFSRRVSFFFTDGPSKHNYLAMGKSLKDAERECHRHFNRLRNYCRSGLGLLKEEQKKIEFDLELHRWSRIYKRDDWQRQHRYIRNLYESNDTFWSDIRETTKQVLSKRLGATNNLETRINIAVEYTLEELSFILIAPARLAELENSRFGLGKIAGTEVPFTYLYYEPWPVMERLVDGYYDSIVRENIGYCVLDIELVKGEQSKLQDRQLPPPCLP